MYEEYKSRATKFLETLEFGVIAYEVFKELGIENERDKQRAVGALLRKNASVTIEWNLYAKALLQGATGKSCFLSGKGPGIFLRNVLSPHVNSITKVLAKNKVAGLARIFFEIDVAFEKMLERKNIARSCGYAILKYLYETENTVTIEELLTSLQIKKNKSKRVCDWFMKTRIEPLKELGLIREKEGKIQLSNDARGAFDLMKRQRATMLAFEQRIKWFYPTEK